MAVTLSSSALARVREYQAQSPGAIGLRFGVKKSGCSGWAYVIDMAQARKADDLVFVQDGVEVLVDPDSLPQVDGTEIDFVSQGLNQQFIFKNPRVAGECGCGESFTTEEIAS
jgi:iron-sulfur cluster assembly protein